MTQVAAVGTVRAGQCGRYVGGGVCKAWRSGKGHDGVVQQGSTDGWI